MVIPLSLEQVCKNSRVNLDYKSEVVNHLLSRDFVQRRVDGDYIYESEKGGEYEIIILNEISSEIQTSFFGIPENRMDNFEKDYGKLSVKRNSLGNGFFGGVFGASVVTLSFIFDWQYSHLMESFLSKNYFEIFLGASILGGWFGSKIGESYFERNYLIEQDKFVQKYNSFLRMKSPVRFDELLLKNI